MLGIPEFLQSQINISFMYLDLKFKDKNTYNKICKKAFYLISLPKLVEFTF